MCARDVTATNRVDERVDERVGYEFLYWLKRASGAARSGRRGPALRAAAFGRSLRAPHRLRAQQEGRPPVNKERPTRLIPGPGPQPRVTLRHMRGTTYAILGVFAFVVAGFIRGGLRYSADPELVLAFSWGLAAAGLVGVLAGGVAIGIHISRQ